MSELNRRQIVWRLGQNERLISSSGRNCQEACLRVTTSPSLAGPHSRSQQPPHTRLAQASPHHQPGGSSHTWPPGQSSPGGAGPHRQGEYRLNGKSHFSPLGGLSWPLPSLSTCSSLGPDSPPRPALGDGSQHTGLVGLEHWTRHQVRAGLTAASRAQGPTCRSSFVPDPLAPKLSLGEARPHSAGSAGRGPSLLSAECPRLAQACTPGSSRANPAFSEVA